MTVFTSDQFGEGRPPVVPENAGYVVAQYSEVDVPDSLSLNDILRLGKLPPNCVPVNLWLHCDPIDTGAALRLRAGIEQFPTVVNVGKITVITAPSVNGNATVNVDGEEVVVALLATDDAAGAATKIAADIDALDGYSAVAVGAVVTVEREDGGALSIDFDGALTLAAAIISGPEDIIPGSELTAAAYPVDGAIAMMTSFPAAILQSANNQSIDRNVVVKVTTQGTTRVAGKVRMCLFYRAVDFGV